MAADFSRGRAVLFAIVGWTLAVFWPAIGTAGILSSSDVMRTGPVATLSSGDGSVVISGSANVSASPSGFGISGGLSSSAVDDADGQLPADEFLTIQLSADDGLTGLDVIWTRGTVVLSGFTDDPVGNVGSYDAATQSWSIAQPWTGGSPVAYRFGNPDASKGATLSLTILDESTAGPQLSLLVVYAGDIPSDTPAAVVQTRLDQVHQHIDHFGGSMLWSIDPTENWDETVKESLALKLMSRAGGIGLSNLRFDFGGGDTGTGNQTAEPWSWRFPVALKDGPDEPFDWSRRAGQQWFLRRAADLGVDKLTLASISPPWWMTKNGRTFCSPEIGTTNLDPNKLEDYAEYLVDILTHFQENEGITFDDISPFNEPEYTWENGSQEGCRYTAADIIPLVQTLYEELEERGFEETTKIVHGDHANVAAMLDDELHNTYDGGVWGGGSNGVYGKYREYMKSLQGEPSVANLLAPVSSYHSYFTDSLQTLDSPLRDLLRQNAESLGVDVLQSEYSILGSYGPGRNLQMGPARHVARVMHRDLTRANSVGWNWWLSLSPHDYKDGLIYTDSRSAADTDAQLHESRVYHLIGHYSRFIRPGWHRIGAGTLDDLEGLLASAWTSPDQTEFALVVSNFGEADELLLLPQGDANSPSYVREWHPWITDRGRSLSPLSPAIGSITIPAQSIITLHGYASSSPFRLRTSITPSNRNPEPEEEITLVAHATWENGVYELPSKVPPGPWVFEPIDFVSTGCLEAGPHRLRRLSDGQYLTAAPDSSSTLFLSTTPSEQTAWEVFLSDANHIQLTHQPSGLNLHDTGQLLPSSGSLLEIQAVSIDASFDWDDGLGSNQTATLSTAISRWVGVRASVPGAMASGRCLISPDELPPSLSGLPEEITVRRGDPVQLRAQALHPSHPWRFRLVPADRDQVVISTSDSSLAMADPKGRTSEIWELVDAEDGRIWSTPEPGRICRIRSVQSDLYLQPDGENASRGDVLGTSAETGETSQWMVDETASSRYRLTHLGSGLVLNISGATGLPILWPDTGVGNDRFHFDSLDLEPATLRWSHRLGDAPAIQATPVNSTNYTVHANFEGNSVSATTRVTVQRTFSEWSLDWLGELAPEDDDRDLDGVPLLLEYARGSNPLAKDSTGWEQVELSSHTVSWVRNTEALGSWTIEQSENLEDWRPSELPLREFSDRLEIELSNTHEPSAYFRLRFQPTP
ncbi:glycoside hydrolase [Roseibacillus persicicus]|uniref:glycoside hydrolase n=1 Tax=Roseibacillus persicicus TaxID=454148 RepID=UPI001676B459|nr:glycoside hydrolase [Roseibacillus persicicus]